MDKTSIAHAYVLSNVHSVIIVCFNLLTGRERVPKMHLLGVAMAMAGASVCVWDSGRSAGAGGAGRGGGLAPGPRTGSRVPPPSSERRILRPTVKGDVVVIAGTFFGASFLVLAKKMREKVELSHYMYLSFVVNLPLVLIAAVSLEDISFTRPFDPRVGALGWLTPQQIGLQLFISVCGTIFGVAGYIASLKYLPPTVVSVAMLMEPIFAALLGWLAKVNAFPSKVTLAGMAGVTLGTLVISLHAGRKRVRAVDISAHASA